MNKFLYSLAITVLMATFSSPTMAQTPPPAFCENNPGFDQFDFWVGDWDVYFNSEAKPLVGHNTITKASKGCVIQEDWVNSGGGDGYSLRHYNPATETWQMFWASNGYTVKTEGAQVKPGEILLEGDIHYFATGQITGFRVRFSANDDGTVRQHAEQYNQETEIWDPWFDGIYERTTK